MIVTGAKLSPRQGNLRRDMRNSAAIQAAMVEGSTAALIEHEWVVDHTCDCHGWFPDSRCHQLQAENAARYVQGRQR
jgi:hypothetical protein